MNGRIFAAFAGLAVLGACGQADKEAETGPAPEYVHARSIKELMANVVEVQAQVYWKSSGAIIDENGETDLTPTSDEAWLRTRSAAATVSEMGNLLMTPLYAEGRSEDWIRFSKALVEVGKRAETAAIEKNGDAVMDVGGTMYNVCQACHQAYPPAQEPPAAAPETSPETANATG